MASEGGTPKDMEHIKRMIAQKKSLKHQVVKLHKLLGTKQDLLPWKEIVQEIPSVIETIEKIEVEKPESRPISPFVDGAIYGEGWERERPAHILPFLDSPIGSEFDISQETDPSIAGKLYEDMDKPILQGRMEEKPKYKPPRDWVDFTGDHWERFDYHMVQEPGTLIQDDLDFIEWYKTTTEYQAIYCPKTNSVRREP